jgi:hypothetical protein
MLETRCESEIKSLDMPSVDFLAAIRKSPEGLKISAAAAAATLARRKGLADELRSINERAAKEWPKAFAASEEAAKAVRAAEKALREANAKLAAANNVRFEVSDVYTRRRAELEAGLAESASPLIAVFEQEMLGEMVRLRLPGMIELRDNSTKNEITGVISRGQISNVESINTRLRACMMAIERSRDMQLQPDHSSVPAALDALRAGLPKIERI